MKNPFVAMALMAAAMTEAFRENKYRDAGIALPIGRSKSRLPGKKQPAGTKLLLRAYKAKHGQKAASIEEARDWYATYLKEQDAKVRAAEAKRKADREARRNPLPLAA